MSENPPNAMMRDPETDPAILEKEAAEKAAAARKTAARQGYGLDMLANDPDAGVRRQVEAWLEENEMSLEEWAAENPDKRFAPQRGKETGTVPTPDAGRKRPTPKDDEKRIEKTSGRAHGNAPGKRRDYRNERSH